MKKTIRIIICLCLLPALVAHGQVATIDMANLAKAIAQLKALYDQIEQGKEQLEQGKQLLKQIGDPAEFKEIVGAAQTLAHLGQSTSEKPAQNAGDLGVPGEGGMTHDGGGVFTPVTTDIQVADGTFISRPMESYRKYEVFYQAVGQFNTVMKDSDERRASLRSAMRQTTERLEQAETDAEVQKLTGVLSAQTSELASIDAERSEAAARVLIIQAANQVDQERQQQADLELRTANLQSALRESARFFKADSRPTLIPNPRRVGR